MSDLKPKVGEYWLCETISIMGNGNSTGVHKMNSALLLSCNVKPIKKLYECEQPTIADFLAQQKPILDKTKSKMVSVASLEKFMRGE